MNYQQNYEMKPEPRCPGRAGWFVFNTDTGFLAGSAYWQENVYIVLDDLADPIGAVQSPDLILPKVARHHKKNPPRWERDDNGQWNKWTQYGWLKVEKIDHRAFHVYRGHEPLCDPDGHILTIETLNEARRLADLHMRQGYPNAPQTDGGLSWEIDPGIDRRWIADE